MTETLPSVTIATNSTYASNASCRVDDHYHNIQTTKVPSYEFRVVEWTNEKDEIVKVGLQVRENIHNQWGSVDYDGIWKDVERVKMRL